MKLEYFRCPNCKQCFERDADSNVSCLVQHGPGDCCHYGQRELTAEEIESRVELIDDGMEVWRKALGW